MAQSGSNGHDPVVDSEDITVYEPAFPPNSDPDDEELIGWFRTTSKGEEGEIVVKLPPELQSPEDSTHAN